MRLSIMILILFLTTSCLSLDINRTQDERWTRDEKEAFLKHSPEWSPSIKAAILQGAAQIGMTVEQLRMSIGRPYSINQTVGSWGVHEQWVYGWSYIYLENGVVTSWQRKR